MFDEKDAEVKYIIFACKETEIFEHIQFGKTSNHGRGKEKDQRETGSNATWDVAIFLGKCVYTCVCAYVCVCLCLSVFHFL